MEKNWILVSILSLALVTISVYLISTNLSLSPQTNLNCKSYSSSESPVLNILFFASESQVKNYAEKLKTSSPFNELYDKITINYIDDYSPDCEIYKGVALLCYSRNLIKESSSCPNDVVVVVKEENLKIRSSSYMNVLSLNSKQSSNVFIHELAHAVANLADEYTPADIPKGSENCAKSCESFGELNNGCFQGCSESEYYRSIDNGIMKTLSSSDFGEFNKAKILSSLSLKSNSKITGNVISSQIDCSKENYYLLTGRLKEGEVEITDRSIETGCIGNNLNSGTFSYKLVDSNNLELTSNNFNPELIFTDGSDESDNLLGGPIQSDVEFYLKVPIISKATNLEISSTSSESTPLLVPLSDIGRRPCL